MVSLTAIVRELDEMTIARRINTPHHEAMARFPIPSRLVTTFDEFTRIIADYYNHHYSMCVGPGGRLARTDAAGRAREIIEREYRRRHGDIVSAFNDARYATNEGLRGVLNVISQGLIAESLQHYVRDVFDRHIGIRWEDKVETIRQVLSHYGELLSPTIHPDQPERYAANYTELVQNLVSAIQQNAAAFRRM